MASRSIPCANGSGSRSPLATSCVSLPIDGRAGPTRRFATVLQPDAVAVDSALGTVAVTGRAQGVLQLIGAGVANGTGESARAALRRPLRGAG